MDMLSIPVVILAIIVVFYFKNAIRATANTVESVVGVTNEVADDSLHTYKNEVRILNAEKRSEQLKKLSSMDTIVSNDDIEAMLNAASETSKEES